MPGSENHWGPSWRLTVSRSKDLRNEEKMVGVPSRKEVECKTDGIFSVAAAVGKDVEKDRTSGAERVDQQVSVCSRYIWLEQNLAG